MAYWALFGLLVPITCNCTSCTHVHELAQNHCGDKSLIIVIIVYWRIDSFFFFAKKAIYSFRATKPAFTSSKLAAETPKVPNLLKVSNSNVQVSKCLKMFFSGTFIANFEHTFVFRVKHLTAICAYFFFTTEWIFKPARIVLNHTWSQYSPCIVSVQSLHSSFHQKIKSIKYNATFAITGAIRWLLEKNFTQRQIFDL